AVRLGAEFDRGGLHLGIARIHQEADRVPDFGLPFDRTMRLYPGGKLQGWEVNGRIPLLWEPLWIEGWYTRWEGDLPWIYLPRESWRAALVYHHHPMRNSKNLEVFARLEAHHRGEMAVPSATNGIDMIPGMTALDFYLQ